MKNKKRVLKSDVGYKVKVIALNDMGISNSTFDYLNKEFINEPMIDYNSSIDFLDLYDENN